MAGTWKDVVVIGGGPAGSVTARQLAARGCNVLLVDARQFPREKPCGGGIQHRCLRFLPDDFPTVAKAVCTSVRLTHGLRATMVKSAERPVVHCVNRAEFDHYLLDKARSAGASVQEGVRVLSVSNHAEGVAIETSAGPVLARHAVAADGANSIANRGLNTRSSFHWQTALYAELETRRIRGAAAPDPSELRVDVNSLPSGYAWLFPKGNHVNIGAGGPNRFARLLSKYLTAFLRADGYSVDDMKWRGHQLPTMTRRTVFARNRIFAVGDAAGMVEPLTGEGISYACHAAHLAADAIRAHFGRPEAEAAYTSAVHNEIRSELVWSQRIVLFSTLFPKAFCAALASDKAWSVFFQVLTGELTFHDLEQNLLGWVRNFGPLLEAAGRAREYVLRLSREVERAERNLESLTRAAAVYAD